MAKMINKNDVKFVDGYIVAENNDIVSPNSTVIKLANTLEEMVQKRTWLDDQPDACAGPNFSSFERKSAYELKDTFTAETPVLDNKVAESLRIMDELEDASMANMLNERLEKFKPLIEFVDKDYFISDPVTCYNTNKFDLPTLGNPLELTKDKVIEHLAYAYGVERTPDCE